MSLEFGSLQCAGLRFEWMVILEGKGCEGWWGGVGLAKPQKYKINRLYFSDFYLGCQLLLKNWHVTKR